MEQTMAIRGRQTIIIKRSSYTTEDPYGNSEAVTTEIPVSRCLIAWGSSSTTNNLVGELTQNSASLQFPHGTVILPDDQFILPGQDGIYIDAIYEMNGLGTYWVPQAGSPIRTKVIVEVERQVN